MLSSVVIQRLIFLFIAILLLFLSVSLYSRMLQLSNSYKLIDQSNELQLNLEKIYSATKEAETSQRGYLLTRDSTFLAPYYNTHTKIDSLITEVRKNIPENQTQQLHLVTLGYLIKHRLERTNYTLTHIDSISAVPGLLESRLTQGKSVMDSIRKQINIMLAEENTKLEESKKIQSEYINLTPKTLLYLSLFSLGILFLAYYRLNHQLKIKNHFADELSKKNEELNAKNEELEKTNEELQSFNYIASHDLREPVRKIKTFVSRIQKEESAEEDKIKYIDRIDAITSHMQLLLDDLFTYSRTSMEQRTLQNVDLNKILEEVQLNIQEMIQENNAVIQSEHLPTVQGVPFQLRQLFENLLHNAIKYKLNDKNPVIQISCKRALRSEIDQSNGLNYEQFFKLTIKDNGIGFDQQYVDKIFNLFQRLHSRKDLAGTGAGLAICRKVVQNHEGVITAEGKPNEGATFYIYLPDRSTASTSDKKEETLSAT